MEERKATESECYYVAGLLLLSQRRLTNQEVRAEGRAEDEANRRTQSAAATRKEVDQGTASGERNAVNEVDQGAALSAQDAVVGVDERFGCQDVLEY